MSSGPESAPAVSTTSHWFDFAVPGAGFGGSVRLFADRQRDRAVYWACLVGDGRPLVTVRDEDLELARTSALEVRGSGLWSAMHCETPDEHWSVGLEAFALSLDDPADAWGDERGDLVPLGFDLEWEAQEGPGPDGRQPCLVTGEVLVGNESIILEAYGWRGVDVHGPGWPRVTAHWDDGAPVGAVESVEPEVIHDAPVKLTADDGSVVRVARSLCRLTGPDGRAATAWWERVRR